MFSQQFGLVLPWILAMDLTGAIASKAAGRVRPFFRDAAGISNLHFNFVFCFEEIP